MSNYCRRSFSFRSKFENFKHFYFCVYSIYVDYFATVWRLFEFVAQMSCCVYQSNFIWRRSLIIHFGLVLLFFFSHTVVIDRQNQHEILNEFLKRVNMTQNFSFFVFKFEIFIFSFDFFFNESFQNWVVKRVLNSSSFVFISSLSLQFVLLILRF